MYLCVCVNHLAVGRGRGGGRVGAERTRPTSAEANKQSKAPIDMRAVLHTGAYEVPIDMKELFWSKIIAAPVQNTELFRSRFSNALNVRFPGKGRGNSKT